MLLKSRRTIVITGLVLTALIASACKPKKSSTLKDIATSNSAKTGMFMPERSDDSTVRNSISDPAAVAALAAKLKVIPQAGNGQDLYIVTTYEQDQILVLKQGEGRPLPLGGVDRNNKVFYLAAPLVFNPKNTSGGLVGSTFFRMDKPSASLVGSVSADGNDSNIYMLLQITNANGAPEDFLVSFLNQLRTKSANPTSLSKIGNDIVETQSGENVLAFREVGNQLWLVEGAYSDSHFKQGSVVWSPDMQIFYSVLASGEPIVQWKRQDDNSMDVTGADTKGVVIPKPADDLLKSPLTVKDAKDLALTGPIPFSSARRATSLAKRVVNVATKSSTHSAAFGLTGSTPTAPTDPHSPGYHDFYLRSQGTKSFGLAGAYETYNGKNSYAVGSQVDLGSGMSGRTVGSTSISTVPGGWFTSAKTTRTTYFQSPGGDFIEMKSTNGAQAQYRYMNAADIQQMQGAARATANSPAQAEAEQAYRDSIRASNAAAQSTIKSADNFETKYATPQGFISNVVVPVGLGAAGGELASEYGKRMSAGINLVDQKAVAGGYEAFAKAGTAVTTSTVSYLTSGDFENTGGINGAVRNATINTAMGLSPVTKAYSGLATKAVKIGSEETLEDMGSTGTKEGLSMLGDVTLKTVFNTPIAGAGIGVATKVGIDAGQVGVDYVKSANASRASDIAGNTFYGASNQLNQLSQVMQNARMPPSETPPSSAGQMQPEGETPSGEE